MVSLGLSQKNVVLVDSKGVVHHGRTDALDENKQRYSQETEARTLGDAVPGTDIFLGLSAPGTLTPEMLAQMAERPLVFAMANPEPEIRPELAKKIRPDCLIGTGRSDYPNQVNNSLCFPFIFRGALDVGATSINEEMKVAAVHALAQLAHAESSDVVATAYGEQTPAFGPDYLIPRAFDPRLIVNIAPAVAQAAMDTGVATRPLASLDDYRRQLERFVYRSGTTMQPVFAAAQASLQRVAYAEGEDKRVLHAAQVAVDEKTAFPIFIGREDVIQNAITQLGLRLKPGENCEIVNVLDIPEYQSIWKEYYDIAKRQGVSQQFAQEQVRTRPTLLGSMLLRRGEADALLCGMTGIYPNHLKYVKRVIGMRKGVNTLATMQMLILPGRQLFICDTNVNYDPTAEQIAEMTILAAEEVQRFGLTPSVALLSHSSFGSADTPTSLKMREALSLIVQRDPKLHVEGEMHGDVALSTDQRDREFPDSRLTVRRQPIDHAKHRRSQYFLQHLASHRRRRNLSRRDPVRSSQAGPHCLTLINDTPNRQHDRRRRGRCELVETVALNSVKGGWGRNVRFTNMEPPARLPAELEAEARGQGVPRQSRQSLGTRVKNGNALAAANLTPFEADGDSVDPLFVVLNHSRVQIQSLRDVVAANVDCRVKSTLRKNVDQHRQRQVFFPQRIFGIDAGVSGNRMTHDDRHHFQFNVIDDLVKQLRMFNFIFI